MAFQTAPLDPGFLNLYLSQENHLLGTNKTLVYRDYHVNAYSSIKTAGKIRNDPQ